MGLQYREVRTLVMDLFKQHYEPLLAEARAEAERRAEQVVDGFMERLAREPEPVRENLREPGMQRALVQAQMEHATNGDPDELELLLPLLISRLREPKKSPASIATQEAIETVGRLTQRQVDLLTGLFVVLKVRFGGVSTLTHLQTHMRRTLGVVAESMTDDSLLLRQLDSSSCLAFDTTRTWNVITILRSTYPNALNAVPADETFSAIADGNSAMKNALDFFVTGEPTLAACFLSNRGVAIAHANISRWYPLPPLAVWVNDA